MYKWFVISTKDLKNDYNDTIVKIKIKEVFVIFKYHNPPPKWQIGIYTSRRQLILNRYIT